MGRGSLGAVCLLIFLSSSSGASAAQYFSEAQARDKAIAILKGDPYGKTASEVRQRIVEANLMVTGTDYCGKAKRVPVWQFHVLVPKSDKNNEIDGTLVIDARSGKLICAGLPFLD